MLARISYGGAAVLLLVALLGLHRATREVAHYAVRLPGGIPATVFEPGASQALAGSALPDRSMPVVLLAHGRSSNRAMLASLARRLTGFGYAVVTFDFRGHGENPEPFDSTEGFSREGWLDDLDSALLWARMQRHYDGQRIALAGHALGARAVMDFAARRDPAVGAVVAISGSGGLDGPYPPPNVLLLFAEGDRSAVRARARSVGAELIGRSQIVLDRSYGDPNRGTAVRATEVPGTRHLTVLYSDLTAQRIADWLAVTLGDGEEPSAALEGDVRQRWAVLGVLASLLLLWGLPVALAPFARRVRPPALEGAWVALGVSLFSGVAALALLAGVDAAAGVSLLEVSGLLSGRDLAALLAVSGLGLLGWGARAGRVRAEGLRDARTWAVAGLLLGFVYATLGVFAEPFVRLFPPAGRLGSWLLVALCALPWFGACEWLLRGTSGVNAWLPLAAKLGLVLLIALGSAAGLVELGSLVVPLVAVFAVLELYAFRLARSAPNPWSAALFQSLWLGWLCAAVLPLA